MNNDPLKNLRINLESLKAQLNSIPKIPKEVIDNAMLIPTEVVEMANEVSSIFKSNPTLINALKFSRQFQPIIKNWIEITNSIQLNSNNELLFRKNLFSEEAKNNFKETYKLSDDEITQAHNTVTNLYINFTSISTFVETINSTKPIKQNTSDYHINYLYNTQTQLSPHPFGKVIQFISLEMLTADIQNFTANFINESDLHVQNSLFVAILSLITYLSVYYRPYK
ncbi:hypothetical protein [Staphylococcus hominis]|uniref:hypothetical protein n=1 Tax=Staphylococcus hominis TaxID=1290 RepID=UPI001F5A3050|nr:hypothetical protein [Staphylococcus hominis]MCI2847631.1 hypothetical protein [Staphylococcus hominis]MCI2849724.1 hypothetical protein [Staphylococcus hominis]MCI2855869.1 hypothetical protein [Staphylococcus hominis]